VEQPEARRRPAYTTREEERPAYTTREEERPAYSMLNRYPTSYKASGSTKSYFYAIGHVFAHFIILASYSAFGTTSQARMLLFNLVLPLASIQFFFLDIFMYPEACDFLYQGIYKKYLG
jgi:hypothetical protein